MRTTVRRLAWCLPALLLLGIGGEADCAGPFGSPEPASDERSGATSALGIGYFFQRTTWKPDDARNFGEIDIDRSSGFIQAGTLLFEESEVFLRIGATDLKQTDGGFKGNYAGSGTVGYRGLWFGNEKSTWGVGPILHGSYAATYKDRSEVAGIVTEAEIKNPWDAALAVGIRYRSGRQLMAFAGPFGCYGSAKASVVSPALGLNLSTTFKEKNNLGVYAGIRFAPSKSVIVEAEGQFTGQFAFGATLAYRY